MQTAVITGGHGVLGKAIASAFTAPGWKVISPSSQELDVTQHSLVESYLVATAPDLLIYCAGITCDRLLARLAVETWDEVLEVNFKAARFCARVCGQRMLKRNFGHIIFISSFSALHPSLGQVAYATSKAALLGLTLELAEEFGSRNIRVNAILPGFIDSPLTSHVSAKQRSKILSDHLLHRFNTPEAVGKFIHHLHHELPHTSGQIFQLDSRTRVGNFI